MKAKPFRIVHLSDLHLTSSDKASRTETKLFGKLKGMNEAFRKAVNTNLIQNSELVLVTGDITDRGDIESWKIFWDAIRSAGLSDKVLVIPGNHDVCCLSARLAFLNRKKSIEADMEKAIAGLSKGNQPIRFPWARVPDPRLVVFSLNSNNLGNSSAKDNALGYIGFYQMESFARLLYKYRGIPVKIVALHHSPNLPEPDTMKKRYGKDWHSKSRIHSVIPQDQRRTLRLLSIAQKVRLIIHGHIHFAEDRRVNGIRIIGAPPTTEPVLNKDGSKQYQFYTYTIKGGSHRVYCQLQKIQV